MTEPAVRLEYRDRIAVMTLDREEKRNAFDEAMWKGLENVVALLRADLPRALVVTGAGEAAFCAGFDVSPGNPQVERMAKAIQARSRSSAEDLLRYIRGVVDGLATLPVPVIAAVNGLAYGGGAELAVRCDLRVMDPGARFCFSEVRLGLMPDWGGGVALARLLGGSRAADLILTARKVEADEALRIGLVNRVSAPGKSLDESLAMARMITANGPRAVRSALAVIRRASGLAPGEALEFETMVAADLLASGECLHGIAAFLGGKDPEFPDPES
jgi:enoyl-CoA hydratase